MIKYTKLILIPLLALASCGSEQPELEKISRNRADSLYQLSIPEFERRMDSLCLQKMQFALQYKLDSIVQQRKAEIIKLQEGL